MSNIIEPDNREACDTQTGVTGDTLESGYSDSDDYVPYSKAAHHAVKDPFYKIEVNMLRRETTLPCAEQVGCDTQLLYHEMSGLVCTKLMSTTSPIHLVLDGWTAPIIASYLGLVIIWYKQDKIFCTVLEFIRLKQKHTGQYMAEVVFDCLKCWGLTTKLFSVCMDNAANCNKLVELLPWYIPTFQGPQARMWCMAHILNLIAKMFISFFFKKGRKKTNNALLANGILVSAADSSSEETNEVIEEENDIDDTVLDEDDGHIDIMAEKGIFATSAEFRMAQEIMPWVSGLARCIHDSSNLHDQFNELVSQNKNLEAHVHFQKEVEIMTGVSDYGLTQYWLSPKQWKIANDLLPVLEIFKEATDLFSKAEVLLVIDVFPTLLDIRTYLGNICEDDDDALSPVICIAAQAVISMADKYIMLCEECKIYFIAIVMCPDRKLQWFKDNGYACPVYTKLKQTVIERWGQTYQPNLAMTSEPEPTCTGNTYLQKRTSKKAPVGNLDDINTYLKEPVVSHLAIIDSGGYMKWWNTAAASHPNLARIGMDYCSVPQSVIVTSPIQSPTILSISDSCDFSLSTISINILQPVSAHHSIIFSFALIFVSAIPFIILRVKEYALSVNAPPMLIHVTKYNGLYTMNFLCTESFKARTGYPHKMQDIYDVLCRAWTPLHISALYPKTRYSPFYITKPSSFTTEEYTDLKHYIQELKGEAWQLPDNPSYQKERTLKVGSYNETASIDKCMDDAFNQHAGVVEYPDDISYHLAAEVEYSTNISNQHATKLECDSLLQETMTRLWEIHHVKAIKQGEFEDSIGDCWDLTCIVN
ncbi:hypothetical protein D9756_011482 [Leucocoprinus leucothites]|uniref:Uncharacterized protein n=1 Tax=Leucocoprinus leucothites TaxID=201217 RepID=A0A8H5CP04_9AGAR|nr:hypothetical protein D9756_011482 [Leucoagaricus leucothites]